MCQLLRKRGIRINLNSSRSRCLERQFDPVLLVAERPPGFRCQRTVSPKIAASSAPNRSNFAAWSRQTQGSAVECWFSRRIGHDEADERRSCSKPACLLDAGLCCRSSGQGQSGRAREDLLPRRCRFFYIPGTNTCVNSAAIPREQDVSLLSTKLVLQIDVVRGSIRTTKLRFRIARIIVNEAHLTQAHAHR